MLSFFLRQFCSLFGPMDLGLPDGTAVHLRKVQGKAASY